MSKLKQSIAVQRQIPEHIRENYPAFVEFIKLYYEFLEETQSQNLESIRDIDTTLEEFIDRFKSELAKNIPVELASDKRTLLRHIRQFYLSRGSEQSFKFVFKALFGQEAELFYPSTQMLRVSDGKWQQEISVFVRLTGSTASLFPLNGKFINIITPRKTIQTFASGVSAYNDTIFEVFIQRDYANEITIGSTVRFVNENGAVYTGEILPCPSKIRVYKAGKGFKVGQLFSLKTSIGNGCLVKITKVNSEGAIQSVQPIKFGLDYVSKFYSYLSSKSIQAYEYVHPLEIGAGQSSFEEYTAAPTGGLETFNLEYLIEGGIPLVLVDVVRNNASVPGVTYTATDGTTITLTGIEAGDIVKLYGVASKGVAPSPNDPGYTEKYSGFIDYGFASMQTYMEYDPNIPVEKELVNGVLQDTHASDRFFADPSYVGDIVQQFYMDASAGVFDDDLAIIEIDIGAVARYPGYYLKSDGFISDEMYIQDGKYYQAFSYVIRVEEELRKYSDIIKALVHPSGMKMFAEYNIFNRIIVSAGVPSVFKFLQFGDQVSNINDTSYNYNSYVYQQNIDGTFEYVPAEGAGRVFTRQNKAAIFSTKNISDATEENLITRNLVNSAGQPVIMIDNYDALRAKGVVKPFFDVIAEGYIISNTNDSAGDPHQFINNYSEKIAKGVVKPFTDSTVQGLTTVQVTDSAGTSHQFITNYSETFVKDYVKRHTETLLTSETYPKGVTKPVPPEFITERYVSSSGLDSDGTSHTFIRNYDEAISKGVTKPLTEVIPENTTSATITDSSGTDHTVLRNYSENIVKDYTKNHVETLVMLFNKQLNYVHEIVKPLVDSTVQIDTNSKLVEKPITETLVSEDTNSKLVEKPITETLLTPEAYSNEPILNKFDNLTIPDNRDSILLSKPIEEILSLLETIAKGYLKNVPEELLILSEEIRASYEKYISELLVSSDAYSGGLEKIATDSQSLSDINSLQTAKNIEDLLTLIELYANSVEKYFGDISITTDSSQLQPELYKYDLTPVSNFDPVGIIKVPSTGTGEIRISEVMQLITEFVSVVRTINLFDETFGVDSGKTLEPRKTIEEIISQVLDSQDKGFAMGTLNENPLVLSDISSPEMEKKPSEDIINTDVNIKGLDKAPSEPINISMDGRMILNPYDSESEYLTGDTYFVIFEDYQASTTLS